MTDNELVQFMRLVMISGCGICAYEKICRKEECIEEDFCSLGVEQWLKQEHKEV
jgi:hypothetical protein